MNRIFLFLVFLLFNQINAQSQCVGTQGEVRWRTWQNVPLIVWEMEDFLKIDAFPNNPDYVRVINSLATPVNYNDYYGAQTKGFIHSTTAGQVVFNVEGDNIAQFYLSTDSTANNLVLIDGDIDNTSELDTVTLQANQYYYFELNHLEFTGEDDAIVRWKADFLSGGISSPNWLIIGGDNLFDVCEPICPKQGTPCNNNTGQEDGNCNCVPNPTSSNTCVGERGVLQTYIYDNLNGGVLAPLNTAISNNVPPDTVDLLGSQFFDINNQSNGDPSNYGMYLQAYLSVPVTGIYSFNITSSDESVFYISSDETIGNKTANEMKTYWWTGVYEHDEFDDRTPSQTISNVLLQANQLYYVELRHKGSAANFRHFGIYWKTPYQARDEWLRIPTFYFFDYTCETSCVKSGVPCNDGNPYTANDQWNGSCGCAGTPCSGPGDCDDPTTSYAAPAECETTNVIDNRADDAWLSCAPLSDSPNPARNGQHWIQYDFGGLYNIGNTQIWNYNAMGATASGFQQVAIDYSTDGIYWENLGTYNWSLASGTNDYTGFNGPNFSNITARYVLISSMDDPNACRGLSKVAFNAIACPRITFLSPKMNATFLEESINEVAVEVTGGDTIITTVALYLDDTWIASDNTEPFAWSNLAALQNLGLGNYKLSAVATDANGTECRMSTYIHLSAEDDVPCQNEPLTITTTDSTVYRTNQTITSSSLIDTSDQVTYLAAQSITLMPGFETKRGSQFTARITDCNPASFTQPVQQALSRSKTKENLVKLFPNPVKTNFIVEINATEKAQLAMEIYDILGKQIRVLAQKGSIEKGVNQFEFNVTDLTAGLYHCKIKLGNQIITKTFVRVGD